MVNRLQKFPMGRIARPFQTADAMCKKTEFPFGTEFRIEQLNGPCSCIPGILQRLFPLGSHLGLQLCEITITDIGFAPHFQDIGDRPNQLQGDAAHRTGIMRDIISPASIPASDSPNKMSLFIDQRQGHTIDFVLDHPFDGIGSN